MLKYEYFIDLINLLNFVNSREIQKDQIQNIILTDNGGYHLIYWR